MIRGVSAFLAIAVALLISACNEQDISGIYIHEFESGIYAHDQESCEPPYRLADGTTDYCYQPIDVTNQLGLRENDAGDLEFAFHLVFFNWHTCSMHGVARKQGSAWVYRDENHQSQCALSIRKDGSDVLLSTSENASCQAYCGMRGYIDGTKFDIGSRVKKDVTPRDIRCILSEGHVENDECQK